MQTADSMVLYAALSPDTSKSVLYSGIRTRQVLPTAAILPVSRNDSEVDGKVDDLHDDLVDIRSTNPYIKELQKLRVSPSAMPYLVKAIAGV